MALRLMRKREPDWVEIGRGAALFCAPPTSMIVFAARAHAAALLVELREAGETVTKLGGLIDGVPDLDDAAGATAASEALLTLSLAELAASDWRGVNDEDGTPLAFDAILLAPLLSDPETMFQFRANYLRPIHEVDAEGNV